MSPPQYIYKIVPSSTPPPTPLPPSLPVSPLDSGDNFIHTSTASQLLRTLALFFKTDSSVYILRIPYTAAIQEVCKWESLSGEEGEAGREGFFPHLYNGLRLGREEIDRVEVWWRGEGWNGESWPFGEVDRPVA